MRDARSERRRSSTGGFTLVELLVVIAILLVLISLLTPATVNVRQLAWRTGCGSNLRQIITASHTFESENGRFPSPNWRHSTEIGWLYASNKMDRLEDIKFGSLWPYLKDYRVYRCPADRTDPATVPNRPNNSRMITSYCSNGSLCAYGRRPYMAADLAYRTYPIADFKATDILYWEPDETRSGGWWHDGSNYPGEGITGRHRDRASVACADGHMEWLDLNEYYRIANSDPRPNRLWNVPRSADGRTPP